ncbi:hypothetical protein Tco_0548280 [Tanacetum coccineum]
MNVFKPCDPAFPMTLISALGLGEICLIFFEGDSQLHPNLVVRGYCLFDSSQFFTSCKSHPHDSDDQVSDPHDDAVSSGFELGLWIRKPFDEWNIYHTSSFEELFSRELDMLCGYAFEQFSLECSECPDLGSDLCIKESITTSLVLVICQPVEVRVRCCLDADASESCGFFKLCSSSLGGG